MQGHQSSKPFFPLNPERVSLPLPLPSPRLGQPEVPRERTTPSENVKKPLVLQRFCTWAPQGPPKDPPRTPKDLSGSSQAPPRDLLGLPQNTPKEPPRPPKDPQGAPKNLQVLKTQQKPMVFQCFHRPPNDPIRTTQAPPRTPKDTPSTPL